MSLTEILEKQYERTENKKLFLSTILLHAINPAFATITDFQEVINFIFKKQNKVDEK